MLEIFLCSDETEFFHVLLWAHHDLRPIPGNQPADGDYQLGAAELLRQILGGVGAESRVQHEHGEVLLPLLVVCHR